MTTLNIIRENKKLRNKTKFIKAILEIFDGDINFFVKEIAEGRDDEKNRELEKIKNQINNVVKDEKLKNRAIKTLENEISVRVFKELKKTSEGEKAANMISYLDKNPPKFPRIKRILKWITRKTYKKKMKKLRANFADAIIKRAGKESKKRVLEHIAR